MDKFASNVTALKAGFLHVFHSSASFEKAVVGSKICVRVQVRLEHGDPVDVYRTGYSRRVFWYPDFEACLKQMLGPWCCEVGTPQLRMSTSTSCGIGMETF